MNHTQAHQLIQAAADGLISETNRRALERHLAGCPQCQAYSMSLNHLEARLSQGLQTRWLDVQPRRFSLEQARSRTPYKESPGLKRLYQLVGVPAFQFGALVVLAAGLILLIGSAAVRSAATPPTPRPVPTVSLTEIGHTGAAEGACGAVASLDARVYRDHDSGSDVIGALPHGETAPVNAAYRDVQTGDLWLQIEFNGSQGWVKSTDIQVTGDCSHMPTVEQATPQPPTATSTSIPAATQNPGASQSSSQACSLVAPSPQTMYADATLGAPVVGTWPSGATAPVLAWAQNGLPPAWFLIRYNGVTGWVWAPWYDPAKGSPCAGLPLTAYPTLVPTVATSAGVCTIAPTELALDHNVYSGPATTYPVIANVATGSYLVATGRFSQDNYDTWIQVDFGGQVGWVDPGSWIFGDGTCPPLPVVDFQPHPPTFTPTPTVGEPGSAPSPTDTATPGPTPTQLPPQLFEMSVGADAGATQQFSASFPWQGNTTPLHHLGITVTGIPQLDGVDGQLIVNVTISCTGNAATNLAWGWVDGMWSSHCGDTLRSGSITASTNRVEIMIDAPIGAADHITYIVTVTVGTVSG